jgi:ATP synthase protein I
MAGSGRNGPALSTIQAVAIASQFGVALAAAVGLGLFVGQWLDGVTHTSPVFTLLGVFLGLAGGVSSGVTIYRSAMRKLQSEPTPRLRSHPRTRPPAAEPEDTGDDMNRIES